MSKSLLSRVGGSALGLVLVSIAVLLGIPVAAQAETCPNAAFRVGPSASLPDCRAYEQVTPAYKGGGRFFEEDMGPGADGTTDLVTASYAAIDGIEDNYGAPGGWYATVRTSSGWVTSPLPPSAAEYQTALVNSGVYPYLQGSLDGRSALWQERSISQPEDEVDFDVSRPGGVVEDVGPLTPPGTPPGEVYTITSEGGLGMYPAGESDDLTHVLFTMNPYPQFGFHFWPFDTTKENETGGKDNRSLYEFVGVGNTQPMLVGVNDSGQLISDCETYVGGQRESHNAMSGDGNTVFFTAVACGSSPPVNELFARIDNGLPDAHTVAISEPTAADCAACDTSEGVLQPAHFEGASEDGSKVFFTTTQPLLGGDTSENVYEYDFDAPEGQRIVRVSGGDSTVSDPTAEVQGVTATSEDGSHVYFVAHGVLTSTPNAQGQSAQDGADNLYVFERDAQYPAGRTAFIASLSENDRELWGRGDQHPADVTPDGDFLVFTSTTEHLTPDDTSTADQVFEYDAQTGVLVRVSIGQNGYNDNGNTDIATTKIRSPEYYTEDSRPMAYWTGLSVSADGSYVFFESTDGLTPQAIDNKQVIFEGLPQYVKNIYEYHDGSVYLISDGQDISGHVHLLGTDASGGDVFFYTVDRLVPQDTDTQIDIYDARVDGGFPVPVSQPECSGDGCQGPLAAAPVLLSPGSEFQAGGNPPLAASAPVVKRKAKPRAKPAKCKQGYMRKKSKCVKKPKAKKSTHRKGSR